MISGWIELAIAFVTGVIGPIIVLFVRNKIEKITKEIFFNNTNNESLLTKTPLIFSLNKNST